MVVGTFFGIAFLEIGVKTDLFRIWVFQICWHRESSTFTASSFRIWNSSAGTPSPPLGLFIAMLPEAHLTSHSRMFGSRGVTAALRLSRSQRPFSYSVSVYSCRLFLIISVSPCSSLHLSLIALVFSWNVPILSPIFWRNSLVFPFYCFSLFLCIVPWKSSASVSLLFSETLPSVGFIFPFSLAFHFSSFLNCLSGLIRQPWWLRQYNLPGIQGTWVRSLGCKDPLEEGMATHSSILAWRIPMDRAAWWATVHGVAKSRTRLSH